MYLFLKSNNRTIHSFQFPHLHARIFHKCSHAIAGPCPPWKASLSRAFEWLRRAFAIPTFQLRADRIITRINGKSGISVKISDSGCDAIPCATFGPIFNFSKSQPKSGRCLGHGSVRLRRERCGLGRQADPRSALPPHLLGELGNPATRQYPRSFSKMNPLSPTGVYRFIHASSCPTRTPFR